MPRRICAASLALLVLFSSSTVALAAQSAEINPFAPTLDQLNARFARIQQEVDRLHGVGMDSAANEMAQRLQYYKDQLAGRVPSLIAWPELDGVAVHAAGSATVEIHPTDRPVILAIGGYNPVQWTLNVFPGARLQRVMVSMYEGVLMPLNVPAGVPVELYSNPNIGNTYFDFYDRAGSDYVQSVQNIFGLTGLAPSSLQGSYSPPATAFSIGTGSEYAGQRVLYESQPLYKQAAAYQLGQDRQAAEQYRFTGLYTTYSTFGSAERHVAQLTPTHAVDGTILPRSLSYRYIAVDPRGPTYYGWTSTTRLPVVFDPITGAERQLPTAGSDPLHDIQGVTFDTKGNRLVLPHYSNAGNGRGLMFYYPDRAVWEFGPLTNQIYSPNALTYSAAQDAYFSLDSATTFGAIRLDRFDITGAFVGRTELSHFITCGYDTCQLASAGDRLILTVPPAIDYNDPLLPALAHSYLIDPSNGNVTILGSLPEPTALLFMSATSIFLLARARLPSRQPGGCW
jgi:hypothetical protein